jgi:hypothetical protein
MRTYFHAEFKQTPAGKAKVCKRFTALDVTLYQRGKDHFAIVYGKQVQDDLSYAQACMELGAALMHSLACDGRVDQRMKGER